MGGVPKRVLCAAARPDRAPRSSSPPVELGCGSVVRLAESSTVRPAPSPPEAPHGRWLRSRRHDLGLLVLPAWGAVAVAVALPPGAMLPPWAWLVLVLGIDVAHVYASLWRTYAVPGEVARRPGLYLGMPLAAWLALVTLAAVAPGSFWTVLAYVAVFHFVRQQWGVAALYRLREGLPGRSTGARIERAAHYAVTVWPVLWWHAHLPRPFTWFTDDDFVPGLPPAVVWALLPVALLAVGLHVGQRVRSRRLRPGRDLWLLTSALVWGVGIWGVAGDAAFTLPNVVHHGVAYLALVWWTARRSPVPSPLRAVPHPGRALLVFLLPLLALALLEEWAWDRFLWFDHPELFGAWGADLGPSATAVALGTLSLPQVVHYLLDGYIWRMDGSNPGLRAVWGPPSAEGGARAAGRMAGAEPSEGSVDPPSRT